MARFKLVLGFLLLSITTVMGQNRDLMGDKEFQELNKLNPAFTGVLNKLRILGNASENYDIGLETRLFKSANHLGFYMTYDDIENLDRKSFNLTYARDFDVKEKLQFKLGANLDYQVKIFHNDSQLFKNFTFKDFNGFEYEVDSLNAGDFKAESKLFDLHVGGSMLYRNLVLGIALNHVNRPDFSVQEGVKEKANIAMNAHLMGFFSLGKTITVIPTGIYAMQKDDVFSSYGVSLNRKNVTLSGQYETLNDQTGYDFGITYRFKKRHLLNVSYRNNLATTNNQKDGTFSATINSNIFKPKQELEGVLDKIKALY